VADADPL
jgi:serine/threonine protein kinase